MYLYLKPCQPVGETVVSWHVFQKIAHKTQQSLISGMSDTSEKLGTSMLPIQGIKCTDHHCVVQTS